MIIFEIWNWLWWGWLILLSIFFIGFATQHMKFSKMLGYMVSIIMIYFFVIKHPMWGSIWFVLSMIFTTGLFWPGVALFRIGSEMFMRKKYADVDAWQQRGGVPEGYGG